MKKPESSTQYLLVSHLNIITDRSTEIICDYCTSAGIGNELFLRIEDI